MNQQGARRGHEDHWWRQLYGDADTGTAGSTPGGPNAPAPHPSLHDTGPGHTPDTLDERVNSALRAVGCPPGAASSRTASPRTASARTASGRSAPAEADSTPLPAPAMDASPSDTLPGPSDTPPDQAAPSPPPADEPTARIRRTASVPRDATPAPKPAAPQTGSLPGPHGTPPPPPSVGFIGDRPPTYAPEPVALPPADPEALGELVPDTVLDGAQYGSLTLRAASQRGDSARYRGDPRRDALLVTRFGTGPHTLILIAVGTGTPVAGAHRAAHDACAWIGSAVGRSCTHLAEDLRTGNHSALRSGLQRLTDRGHGRLRARAAELDRAPQEYTASLRCLLLPADPDCRLRVFFGMGEGGILRLHDDGWQDLEPPSTDREAPPAAGPSPRSYDPARPDPFVFGTVTARRGDTLLLCSAGLAEPLADEPAFATRLATAWSAAEPPGLTAFLTTAQIRVKGHAKDRTAVAVWDT
ncbi:protein phosphatase 2C domain-containing protein [Streptomyces pinistramenti]|uniref:protein phosphatase 2C domain-containing protein n=1 Tax=Streptomyces pinistramenti TaxID=2884812 RepID=UPI001D08F84B|nr:protein phosphatase 2C domain-containing protein [Streptomyces pinistramenti]MCB5908214.1 protein phosphatase 2C domain-containing protein [Streptomyces pinistramenti]